MATAMSDFRKTVILSHQSYGLARFSGIIYCLKRGGQFRDSTFYFKSIAFQKLTECFLSLVFLERQLRILKNIATYLLKLFLSCICKCTDFLF